jgi:deoxyribonuclease V
MAGKRWPASPEGLERIQRELAARAPVAWRPAERMRSVTGCFVCFARGRAGAGAPGDPGWAAAVWMYDGVLTAAAIAHGPAAAGYEPGLLALREGWLLEAAVRGLPVLPEVLIMNATGRDHPRRAGLAVHLGARLDVPSVGVTNRPLLAEGAWPADVRGATSPLRVAGELVGYWVRTKRGVHPVAVHAGWRIDPDTAVAVILSVTAKARTPEPLRHARRVAREARAGKAPVIPRRHLQGE